MNLLLGLAAITWDCKWINVSNSNDGHNLTLLIFFRFRLIFSDKCYECEVLLTTTDYYRTTKRVPNPYYHVPPHERAKSQEFEKFLMLNEDAASSHLMNKKNVFVSLCRRCYCKALKGESKFWEPSEVPLLFRKTRHCSYVHDHQNIPLFTHKTDCKILRRLRRKEILMSKYYPDTCDRVYKAHVQ